MDIVIVYHNRIPLMLFPEVAKALGIDHGYRIKTESEFWEILNANATYGLNTCNLEIAKENKKPNNN